MEIPYHVQGVLGPYVPSNRHQCLSSLALTPVHPTETPFKVSSSLSLLNSTASQLIPSSVLPRWS